MVAVYLVANHPVRIELIPNGTIVTGANVVNVANNTLPADFYKNYNTYMYSAGLFIRDIGITINNNMNTTPITTRTPALVLATNTPAI